MKTLKRLFLTVLILTFKLLRKLKTNNKTILIGPPFPNHVNIGDRGLVLGALCHLNNNTKDLILVQMTDSKVQAFPDYLNITITDKYFNMFQKHKDLFETIKWLSLLTSAKDLYLVGADSVDFYYNRSASEAKLFAANIAGRIGVNSRVMSFSINSVDEALKSALTETSQHTKLIARDPVSFNRLKESSIPNIYSSADLSFLFKAGEVRADNDLLSFLEKNKENIIGLSFNNLLFDKAQNHSDVYELYSSALSLLATKTGNKLLFIPNNITDSPRFSSNLCKKINSISTNTAYLTEYLGDPSELKALMSHCRYYFSTTLHMALFPMSVGVPTSSFPYAGKFEGPMSFFDLENCLLYLEELPDTPEELCQVFYEQVMNEEVSRKKLMANIDKVTKLAQVNFI